MSLDASPPPESAFDPPSGAWPGLRVGKAPHAAALAELAAAVGECAAAHPRPSPLTAGPLRHLPVEALPSLALALSARAAQAGDPGSLYAAGVRAATGAVGSAAVRDWRGEEAAPARPSPPSTLGAGVLSLHPPDWPAALPHLYFAAAANDTLAQMALGARHAAGAGVPQSCPAAVLYFDPPARATLAAARSPGGLPSLAERGPRLGGYRGGGSLTWGPGLWGGWASGGGGGPWSKRGRGLVSLLTGGGPSPSPTSTAGRRPTRAQEILHYQWFADQGNVDAARALGRLLAADGGGGVEGGVGGAGAGTGAAAAAGYLRRAAEAGDAAAAAALGHMAAAGVPAAGGLGQDQAALPGGAGAADFPPQPPRASPAALAWFRRGAERGHPSALYGLGYLHLAGAGGAPPDARKALAYFTAAADGGSAEAWFHLGVMHWHGWGLPSASPTKARHYFGLAARVGHVLAQYNLAMLHLSGAGGGGEGGVAATAAASSTVSPADCERALALLQRVAERGPALTAELKAGAIALAAGDTGTAAAAYLRAAEAGSELGAANAAWLLARAAAAPPGAAAVAAVPPAAGPAPAAAALASRMWQRAAAAGNTDALLRLGDAAFDKAAAAATVAGGGAGGAGTPTSPPSSPPTTTTSTTTTTHHHPAPPPSSAWLEAAVSTTPLPGGCGARARPCLHAGGGTLAALAGCVSNVSDLIDDLAAPTTPGSSTSGDAVDWAAWASAVSGAGAGASLGAEVVARFLLGRAAGGGGGGPVAAVAAACPSSHRPSPSSFGSSSSSAAAAGPPALLRRLSSGDGGGGEAPSAAALGAAAAAAAAEVEGAWAFAGCDTSRGLAVAARDASGREALWWGAVPGGPCQREGVAFTNDPAAAEAALSKGGGAAPPAPIAWTELPPGHLVAVRAGGPGAAAALRPVRFALSRAEVAAREAALGGGGGGEDAPPPPGPSGPATEPVAVPEAPRPKRGWRGLAGVWGGGGGAPPTPRHAPPRGAWPKRE